MVVRFKIFNIFILYIVFVVLFRSVLTTPHKDFFGIARYVKSYIPFVEYSFMIFLLVFSFTKIKVRGKHASIWVQIVLLLVIFWLSVASNAAFSFDAVKFFAGYFLFIGIFVYSQTCMGRDKIVKKIKTLKKTFIVVFILQFILNLTWYLNISPIENSSRLKLGNVDWAYGTMMSTEECGSLSYFILTYILIYLITSRNKIPVKIKAAFMAFGIMSICQILWADAKLSMALFVVVLAVAVITIVKMNPFARLTMAVMSVLLIVSAVLLYGWYTVNFRYQSLTIARVLLEQREEFISRIGDNPKIIVEKNIVSILPEYVMVPALGGGPGNVSSNFSRVTEKIERSTSKTKIGDMVFGEVWNMTSSLIGFSVMVLPSTGVNSIWGDLGVFGLILYLGVHITLITKLIRCYGKSQRSESAEMTALLFSVIVVLIHYTLYMYIYDILYTGYRAPLLWIAGGMLINYFERKENAVYALGSY